MAFTVLEKLPRGGSTIANFRRSVPRITLGMYPKSNTVEFILSTALLVELGWKVGGKFQLSLGTGQDHGWLRVTPSPTGDGYTLNRSGSLSRGGRVSGKFSWSRIPKSVTHLPRMELRFIVSGGALFIQLPSVLVDQKEVPTTTTLNVLAPKVHPEGYIPNYPVSARA